MRLTFFHILKGLVVLGILMASCKKIPNELEHLEGTYKWNYSHLKTQLNHGVLETFPHPEADEYCIILKHRRVVYVKNGKKEFSERITSVTNQDNFLVIGFEHPRKTGYTLYISKDGLTTEKLPFSAEIENQSSINYFIKQ